MMEKMSLKLIKNYNKNLIKDKNLKFKVCFNFIIKKCKNKKIKDY